MSKLYPSQDRPIPNTYWVDPGSLLAGEYPGGADSTDSQARLEKIQGAGIDYFIDLTEEDELPPYRHLLPARVKYLRSPITDTSVPGRTQMQQLLADIRAALALGRCIYVHCRAGIGRTGLVVGCHLAQTRDGKAALKHLNQLWLQSERSASWPAVPQTPEQGDYIRRWPKLAQPSS